MGKIPGNAQIRFYVWRVLRVPMQHAGHATGVVLVFVLLISGWSARAQQDVSTSAEPGQIEKRFEAPPESEVPSAPALPIIPERQPALEGEGGPYILTGISIEGATVYTVADLASLYEDYLARPVSLAEIERLLEAITAKYREDGYYLSRAIVEPQLLEFGVLRIRVIEGFIEHVSFEGAQPGGEDLLRGYAQQIEADRPARLEVLERYLLLINDLPGIEVTPRLHEQGDSQDRYDLILELDYDSVEAFASLDNRGTRSVGPLQAQTSVTLNSVLGMLDRSNFTFATVPNQPRELQYFAALHEQPLTDDGSRISFFGSYSNVDAGGDLDEVDVGSLGRRFSTSLTHPVIRQRRQILTLIGRFDYSTVELDRQDSAGFEDRLRVLRLGGNYVFADQFGGTTSTAIAVSQGLDILGASKPGAPNLSRPDGKSNFTKLTVEATRNQRLTEDWAIAVAAKAQVSADPLLSSEEFALGGSRFGRAYDPSELTGDNGAAVSIELQFERNPALDYLRSYQLFAFYDFGAIWQVDGTANAGRESLASAGFGLRLQILDGLYGSVELAVPLTREVADRSNNDPRVFFSLAARF